MRNNKSMNFLFKCFFFEQEQHVKEGMRKMWRKCSSVLAMQAQTEHHQEVLQFFVSQKQTLPRKKTVYILVSMEQQGVTASVTGLCV